MTDIREHAGVAVATDGEPWAVPEFADRGVLVLHGAGTHAPITTLAEILDSTFERMRAEGTLVGVHPFTVGDPAAPGGAFAGLVTEYTRKAMPDHAVPKPDEVRTMLIVEGRWDGCFLEPSVPIVSAWAAAHVAPMAWEILKYHLRSVIAVAASMITLALLTAGLFLGLTDRVAPIWAALIFGTGMAVSFVAALADSYRAWTWERRILEGSDPPERVPSRWWIVPPAFTLMVYYVQRGLVLIIVAAGMLLLPLLAFLTRLLATIPGIDRLAAHAVANFERFALGQAATDIETISHSYVSAAAIQSRVKAGLREVQSHLRPGSDITVLAHSAGAPLAWWLLSEPDLHHSERNTSFRYRLVTVGGALNWAKRGMQCDATPLDWPLVAAREPLAASVRAVPGAGGGDGSAQPDRTKPALWVNVYSTWDPAPHGPVRASEYAGPWRIVEPLDGTKTATDPDARPAGLIERIAGRAAAICAPTERANTTSADGQRSGDPNIAVRNLGSPVSAEHSEYFRNQQEFVPLLVHCIDPDIEWVQDEVAPRRREQWSNLRLALISALVRVRMLVFSLPVAYTALAVRGRGSERVCTADVIGADWLRATIGSTRFIDPTEGSCSNMWAVDLAIILGIALIAYAAVEVYTNFCWGSLGRGVRPLDWRHAPKIRWWPPSSWRFFSMAPWPVVLVWLPAALVPLLLLPFDVGAGLWALVGINFAVCVAELFWCSRCLHGLRDPDSYPETWIKHGRRADYPFAL